jgi:hypothetical protein
MDPDVRLQKGEQIQVGAPSEKIYFFDPQTEAAIR